MEIQITSCFSFCYEKNTEMRNIKYRTFYILFMYVYIYYGLLIVNMMYIRN